MMSSKTSPAGETSFFENRPGVQNVKKSKVMPEVLPSSPSELPIPEMGFALYWYRFKLLFNEHSKPPKLGKKEVALRKQQADSILEAERIAAREARKLRSIQDLRNASDRAPRGSVAFVGVKGAAATTTTLIHCASTTAEITRAVLYASDFNSASGTAGRQLGKDFSDTLTVRKFRELLPTITGQSDLNPLIRPTRYGVRVLSANDYTADLSKELGTHTSQMLDLLSAFGDYNFIDTTNSISTPEMRVTLGRADMLVFTANVAVKNSLFLLGVGMQAARQLGLERKVANSVVVISNSEPGANPEDYRKYTDKVNISDEAVELYGFDGPIILVPHDPSIKEDSEVNLEALMPETYQAYLDVDNKIFELLRNTTPYVKKG